MKSKNFFKELWNKINPPKTTQAKENPLEIYCHTIYRYIGRPLLQKPNFKKFFNKNIYNVRYEGILKKANLKLIPEEYFMSILVTMMGLLTLITVGTITGIILGNPILPAITFFGGIIALIGIGIFLYNYPVVIAKQRGAEIDAAIPYILPYMKILAKELNLSKITEIITEFIIYKEMKVEFQKIKYYSTIIGYDIHSSIRESMMSCPSRQLSDIMNDLVTISNSGGNIYNYLERKLTNLNQEIDALEKKNIDQLLIYSQIYVVLLLISPLFYTIMSSILNMINFNAGGGSNAASATGSIASTLFMLMALPLFYAAFMMLVYYSKPLYSRLKPIKND